MLDAGAALSGLSCFLTPDLARDLAGDIMTLVNEKFFCTQRHQQELIPYMYLELRV